METVALFVGWAVTVAIAVGGWLVSQAQARRATRSNMRINYLLDAYRRLARSGNRPLTSGTAQDIEAAIQDVMLLGSPSQVKLAEQFGRQFANEKGADLVPILMDLRSSLREELLLEELPPTYFDLRVSTDGEAVSYQSRIWRETIQSTRQSIHNELGDQRIPADYANAFPAEMTELATSESPSAAVVASAKRVEDALRTLLGKKTDENVAALNLAQLTNRALELNLIDHQLADSLNGFGVMCLLASTEPERLDRTRAMEFASLAAAILYLLDTADRRKSTVPSGGPGIMGS